jgi:hypothetical protein
MNAPVRTEAQTMAYSYVRFSTPSQQEGASFQRQMEKATKFALDHGLTLNTELNMTDIGVSAYRGKNARTGALAGFLEAVHKEYVPEGSYLLVENIDRLSRDDFFEAQTLFQQLIVSGINIAVLATGEVYSHERLKKQPYEPMKQTYVAWLSCQVGSAGTYALVSALEFHGDHPGWHYIDD